MAVESLQTSLCQLLAAAHLNLGLHIRVQHVIKPCLFNQTQDLRPNFDNGICKGEADVEKPLRETYFYRKGTYIPSSLPSYTVHIPEKAILRK